MLLERECILKNEKGPQFTVLKKCGSFSKDSVFINVLGIGSLKILKKHTKNKHIRKAHQQFSFKANKHFKHKINLYIFHSFFKVVWDTFML